MTAEEIAEKFLRPDYMAGGTWFNYKQGDEYKRALSAIAKLSATIAEKDLKYGFQELHLIQTKNALTELQKENERLREALIKIQQCTGTSTLQYKLATEALTPTK